MALNLLRWGGAQLKDWGTPGGKSGGSSLWNELLHPRGPDGRFIKKWGMSVKAAMQVFRALTSAKPHEFSSNDDAKAFATARHASLPGTWEKPRYRRDYDNANLAIAQDRTDPTTAKFTQMMDSKTAPLDEDLVITAPMNPDMFGLGPDFATPKPRPDLADPGEEPPTFSDAEDLTGRLVRSRGYVGGAVGDVQDAPNTIRMVVMAPKGTRVTWPNEGRSVDFQPGQDFRISSVEPDGRGGFNIFAVATSEGTGEKPDLIGLDKAATEKAVKEGLTPQQREAQVTPGGLLSPPGTKALPGNIPAPLAPGQERPSRMAQPGFQQPQPGFQRPARQEQLAAPAVGGPPAPAGGAPAVPEAGAPGAPERGAMTGMRFRRAVNDGLQSQALVYPTEPSARKEFTRAVNGAGSNNKNADPENALRVLEADIRDNRDRAGDNEQLRIDADRQEKLAQLIADSFGFQRGVGTEQATPVTTTPEPQSIEESRALARGLQVSNAERLAQARAIPKPKRGKKGAASELAPERTATRDLIADRMRAGDWTNDRAAREAEQEAARLEATDPQSAGFYRRLATDIREGKAGVKQVSETGRVRQELSKEQRDFAKLGPRAQAKYLLDNNIPRDWWPQGLRDKDGEVDQERLDAVTREADRIERAGRGATEAAARSAPKKGSVVERKDGTLGEIVTIPRAGKATVQWNGGERERGVDLIGSKDIRAIRDRREGDVVEPGAKAPRKAAVKKAAPAPVKAAPAKAAPAEFLEVTDTPHGPLRVGDKVMVRLDDGRQDTPATVIGIRPNSGGNADLFRVRLTGGSLAGGEKEWKVDDRYHLRSIVATSPESVTPETPAVLAQKRAAARLRANEGLTPAQRESQAQAAEAGLRYPTALKRFNLSADELRAYGELDRGAKARYSRGRASMLSHDEAMKLARMSPEELRKQAEAKRTAERATRPKAGDHLSDELVKEIQDAHEHRGGAVPTREEIEQDLSPKSTARGKAGERRRQAVLDEVKEASDKVRSDGTEADSEGWVNEADLKAPRYTLQSLVESARLERMETPGSRGRGVQRWYRPIGMPPARSLPTPEGPALNADIDSPKATVADLRAIARNEGVPSQSTYKTKAALRDAIRRHRYQQEGARQPEMPEAPRAVEPMVPESQRATDFREALQKKRFSFPDGDTKESMAGIMADLDQGRITPDEAVRRIEGNIATNNDRIGEIGAHLRRLDVPEDQRKDMQADLGRLERSNKNLKSASEWTRKYFNKEPVVTQEEALDAVRQVEQERPSAKAVAQAQLGVLANMPGAPKDMGPVLSEAIERDNPSDREAMRELAKLSGVGELKGDSAAELFTDWLQKGIKQNMEAERAGRKPKAPKKVEAPEPEATPAAGWDSPQVREIAAGLEIDEARLDSIQKELDNPKNTPGSVGRKIESWAGTMADPRVPLAYEGGVRFRRSPEARAAEGLPPLSTEEFKDFEERKSQANREWLRLKELAQRLKATRRKRATAPRPKPAELTPEENAQAKQAADLAGVPETTVVRRMVDRKEVADTSGDEWAKGQADLIHAAATDEQVNDLLKGKTAVELKSIAKVMSGGESRRTKTENMGLIRDARLARLRRGDTQLARDRQLSIDEKRKASNLIRDIMGQVSDGAEQDLLRRTIRQRADVHGAPDDVRDRLIQANEGGTLDDELRSLAAGNGIEIVHPAGDVVPFDRKTMSALGDINDGDPVLVMRPGTRFDPGTGKPVLDKATVIKAGPEEVTPAAPALPRRAPGGKGASTEATTRANEFERIRGDTRALKSETAVTEMNRIKNDYGRGVIDKPQAVKQLRTLSGRLSTDDSTMGDSETVTGIADELERTIPTPGETPGSVKAVTPPATRKATPAKASTVDESVALKGDPQGDNMRMHGDSLTMGLAQDYAKAGRNGSANDLMDLRRRATAKEGGISPQQVVDELKALRAQEQDPTFQRKLDQAIAGIDAPMTPLPDLPDSTPPLARKLIEDLHAIPYARKGKGSRTGAGTLQNDSLVDQVAQVYRDAAAGTRGERGDRPDDRIRKILRDQTHEINEASFPLWKMSELVDRMNTPLAKELRNWERGNLSTGGAETVARKPRGGYLKLDDVSGLTIPELRRLAENRGVPNAANLNKDALLDALLGPES